MTRKKILWLCSWYPNQTDPFDGDFIQRHAIAASLFNDIHVIHVAPDHTGKIGNTSTSVKRSEGLTEEIFYFKKASSFLGRIKARYRLLSLYRKAINKFIGENGRPDLVHVHIPMKAGLAGLWVKKKFDIPFVVTEHWGIYNEVEKLNFQNRGAWFKKQTKRIFQEASRCISVSRFLAAGVNKWVLTKEFSVIPNTVDTTLFHCSAKTDSSFQFIHVSNMVPLKNVEGMLRGFKQVLSEYPEAHLQMIGNRNDQWEKYAVALGIPERNFRFTGELPYADVARAMKNADCLVLFSTIENSPCVIGEALCCGLPVIASAVGGVPELINENNSLLIGSKDEAALTDAMKQMIAERGRYDRVMIAKTAAQKFSYEAVGKMIDEMYRSV